MSADNYILIIKNGNYKAYNLCASMHYADLQAIKNTGEVFTADTIKEAIKKAQSYDTEYGYSFLNLED